MGVGELPEALQGQKDGRERRLQIVRHRRQQVRLQPFAGDLHPRLQGLAGVVVAVDGHRQIARDDLHHPFGRLGPATLGPFEADPDHALPPLWSHHRPEVEPGVLRRIDAGARRQPRGGHPLRRLFIGGAQARIPGRSRQAELVLLFDQHHRRRLEHPVQRQGRRLGDGGAVNRSGDVPRHHLQRPRLLGGVQPFQGAPARLRRDGAHDRGGEQQKTQAPDIGRIGDAQGVQRSGQEEVHRQDSRHRRGHGRLPAEADRRDHHRQDEDQRQVRDADELVHHHRRHGGGRHHQQGQHIAQPCGRLAVAFRRIVLDPEAHLAAPRAALARPAPYKKDQAGPDARSEGRRRPSTS